jgi:hypothetical protein
VKFTAYITHHALAAPKSIRIMRVPCSPGNGSGCCALAV